VDYPSEWAHLESPSQRYELMCTLGDFMSVPDDAPLDMEALAFIYDDISADERQEGIVGGCLLNETEDASYRAFLRILRTADDAGCRMTKSLRAASASLLSLMEASGLPQHR
jgi:hypothetical protein